MPQSERTVAIFFGPEDWLLLEKEAVSQGLQVREVVTRHVGYLITELKVIDRLDPPPGEFLLDGDIADEFGALAIKGAAKRLGHDIKCVGGKRHDGAVYTKGGERA